MCSGDGDGGMYKSEALATLGAVKANVTALMGSPMSCDS